MSWWYKMKNEKGIDLALAHWNYICGLMTIHGIDEKTMEIVKFHYMCNGTWIQTRL